MSKSTKIILLLAITIMFDKVQASCVLCNRSGGRTNNHHHQHQLFGMMPIRLDCILEHDIGMTCGDLFAKLLLREDDDVCELSRQKYQETCCGSSGDDGNNDEGDDEATDLCYTGPTSAPVYDGEKGEEPICRICGTEEYPGKAQHLFTTRYVGTYSCGELYSRGLNGLIPGFLCGPLQDYAHKECGCGVYNPKCINDPTKCFQQQQHQNNNQADEESPPPKNKQQEIGEIDKEETLSTTTTKRKVSTALLLVLLILTTTIFFILFVWIAHKRSLLLLPPVGTFQIDEFNLEGTTIEEENNTPPLSVAAAPYVTNYETTGGLV